MEEGDYSTLALMHRARIERKSRADFASSITWGRERLDREMVRLQDYPWRAVVVEANVGDFGEYRDGDFGRRGVHLHAVLGTVASYGARYGVPVYFMGNATNAGKLMVGLFRRWEEQMQEQA
jgi:ERCC4-type nuclease